MLTVSSNTSSCSFLYKIDIKLNVHILSVHALSFDKYIYIGSPKLYQNTEHYHLSTPESDLIIIPVNLYPHPRQLV